MQLNPWFIYITRHHRNWIGEHPNKNSFVHSWDVQLGYSVLTHSRTLSWLVMTNVVPIHVLIITSAITRLPCQCTIHGVCVCVERERGYDSMIWFLRIALTRMWTSWFLKGYQPATGRRIVKFISKQPSCGCFSNWRSPKITHWSSKTDKNAGWLGGLLLWETSISGWWF